MDTHLFRPAMDSKGLFTVNGTDILGAKDFSGGLILDYAHVLLRTGGLEPQPAHRQLVSGDAPVQLRHREPRRRRSRSPHRPDVRQPTRRPATQALYAGKWGPTKLDFQGVGYLGAHAKWRILKVEHGFGLAVGVQIGQGLGGRGRQRRGRPGLLVLAAAHGREALRVDRPASPRGQRRLSRAQPERYDAAPEGRATYVDGNLWTYGGGASLRVLEPLDLVAETYGTYLISSAAEQTA